MNVVVSIYTLDKDVGCLIDIHNDIGTNNYKYVITSYDEDDTISNEGIIYNFEGDYLELVKVVLNGRNLS